MSTSNGDSKRVININTLPIKIDRQKIVERKQVEIIPNIIKPNDAVIVRKSVFKGFAEKVYVVHHTGKSIRVKELK